MATLKIQQARWAEAKAATAAKVIPDPTSGPSGPELINTLSTTGADYVRVGRLEDLEEIWVTNVAQVRRCGGGGTRGDAQEISDFGAWADGDLEIFTAVVDGVNQAGYLLQVDIVGRPTPRWLLVDKAWLLGDDGSTIERIAP